MGFTAVFGVAVGLLDVELRNGAMEPVRVAFLEKMVNVGITRGFAVELVVGVEWGLVGVDVGTVGVGLCTVGSELDTVRGERDSEIVTPAVSQKPSVTLTISRVRSDKSTFRVETETYSGSRPDYIHV